MCEGRPVLCGVPEFEPSTEPYGAASTEPYGAAPAEPYGAAPAEPYGAAPAESYGGSPPVQRRGAESPPGGLPAGRQYSGVIPGGTLSSGASTACSFSPSPSPSPSARAGARRRASIREAGTAPDEFSGSGSTAPASTCAPAETFAGCRPRIGRKSLRTNRSAPAGIRRAQRAGHTAGDRTEPSEAREFAGRALRILLEVLDRRRPVAQLNTLCAAALVHTVGVLVAGDHAPSRTLGAAVLTKFRLFAAEDDAFELIAMYQRGPRRLALAGRVEHTATGWKLTALRLT